VVCVTGSVIMNFCRGESLLMIRGSKKLPPKTDSQINENFVHSLIQRNVTESSEKQNASLTALTRRVEKMLRCSVASDFKTATTTRNPPADLCPRFYTLEGKNSAVQFRTPSSLKA